MRMYTNWRRIIAAVGVLLFFGAPPSSAQGPERSRVEWWNEARFGLFVHWGLYALHAGDWRGKTYENASEWLMFTAQIPPIEYRPFVRRFNPTAYNPAEWVRIARQAGVKYLVVTAKHHDGFSLFESEATDYDVGATPWGRDLLQPLVDECRTAGIRIGFYYSILDWDHPDYLPRGPESPRPWDDRPTESADLGRYLEFVRFQLKELLTNYGPVDVLWFDGGWEHSPEDIDALGLVSFVRGIQPDILINNRLGIPEDFETPEQKIPVAGIPDRNWETCMTMNNSWGYKKSDLDWKTSEQLVRRLVETASKGGNFLLNVGPKADGTLPAESVQRLEAVGNWLTANGESVYGTSASPFPDLTGARCTMADSRLYIHLVSEPTRETLLPRLESPVKKAYYLASPDQSVNHRRSDEGVLLDCRRELLGSLGTVVVVEVDGQVQVGAPPPPPTPTPTSVPPPAEPTPTPTRRIPLTELRRMSQEQEKRAREEKVQLLSPEEKRDVFLQDFDGTGLQLSPGWLPSGTGTLQPRRSLPAWEGGKGGQGSR